jgi:hypothetical protein
VLSTETTWLDPESNTGLHGGKPATDRLINHTICQPSFILVINYCSDILKITYYCEGGINKQEHRNTI